jgi:hypothetical protein
MLGVVVVAVAITALVGCDNGVGASLARVEDPVVFKGGKVPKLIGHDPQHIVAFAWDGSAWQQVPVQVDQRDFVNPGQIYNRTTDKWAKRPDGTAYTTLVYTPTPSYTGYRSYGTYTPPDRDPTLDSNDEVSLLAADVGQLAPSSAQDPSGVTPSTRERITVKDPLDASAVGYIYLYASPTLDGGAVTSGVDYQFRLDSGNYKQTYGMGTASSAPNDHRGSNPEHSTVTTARYRMTYSDRWVNDGLQISQNGSTGADLLDRDHYLVPNLGCIRNEDTFDDVAPSSPYEGAFIVNISGPVRAIRSHIGANSFRYTIQTELFYPDRQDSVTELKGHAGLPGYANYDDLTTGLTGQTYSDPQNSDVKIDGVSDPTTPISWTTGSGTPPAAWQLIKGPAGSIVTARTIDTDLEGASVWTYYHDASPASPTPCTGDASTWGQDGFQILAPDGGAFPNTDPTLEKNPPKLTTTRTRFLLGPNTGTALAAHLADRVMHPVTVTVS